MIQLISHAVSQHLILTHKDTFTKFHLISDTGCRLLSSTPLHAERLKRCQRKDPKLNVVIEITRSRSNLKHWLLWKLFMIKYKTLFGYQKSKKKKHSLQ